MYLLESIYQKYKSDATSDIYPVICDIKIEGRAGKNISISGETDIKNEISLAITGRADLYEEVCTFLENNTQGPERLLLLVNVRVYHRELMEKIVSVIDELWKSSKDGSNFTYVICCTEAFRSEIKYNNPSFSRATVYSYKYKQTEKDDKHPSFYLISKGIEDIVSKKFIMSQIGVVDNRKINSFSAMLFENFGIVNESDSNALEPKKIKIDDIVSPLTLSDIIHISERTGITTIDYDRTNKRI